MVDGRRRHLPHASHCTRSTAVQPPLWRADQSLLHWWFSGLNQFLTDWRTTSFCSSSGPKRQRPCFHRLSRMVERYVSFHWPATVHS